MWGTHIVFFYYLWALKSSHDALLRLDGESWLCIRLLLVWQQQSGGATRQQLQSGKWQHFVSLYWSSVHAPSAPSETLHICTAGMCYNRRQEGKKETNGAGFETAEEGSTQLQRGKTETICKCWPGRQFISEREGCAALALSGAAGIRAEGLSAADKLWQNLFASSSHNPAEGEPWQKRRDDSFLWILCLYLLFLCMTAVVGLLCSWSDHSEDNWWVWAAKN